METIARVNQEIPLELLLQILPNLPVKSLCRFRCVSKLWHSVIADPHFGEAHSACSAARPKLLLLFRGRKRVGAREEEYRAYTCELNPTGMELRSPDNCGLMRTSRNLVPVQNPLVERGCISQVDDGLYCLPFSPSVRLWNPNTRESLDIKTVATKSDYGFYSANHFGFDPVEKKHKVLNILAEPHNGKAIRSRVFILEDNHWRATANAHPPHFPDSETMICIDGIIFYFYYEWSEQKLMAFHVRSETFEEISFPEPSKRKTLIAFVGRAALVNSDYDQGITLWLLEDLQQRVWTPKAPVVPNYDLGRLILKGGTPTGELLFSGGGRIHHEPFFVLLYNAESNAARRIELQGLHPKEIDTSSSIHMKVHFHVESLRSPKGVSSVSINTTYRAPEPIEDMFSSLEYFM